MHVLKDNQLHTLTVSSVKDSICLLRRSLMKVGIFAPNFLAYGGGEKYVCKIAEILSREHDVDLITSDMSERQFAEALKTLENRLNVNLTDVNLKVLATPG